MNKFSVFTFNDLKFKFQKNAEVNLAIICFKTTAQTINIVKIKMAAEKTSTELTDSVIDHGVTI